MEVFGKEHEDFLRNYLELPNGIPSHDAIRRVFVMVPSEFLENFQKKWNEMLNSGEGKKVKRLLMIDGKPRGEAETKLRRRTILSVPWMKGDSAWNRNGWKKKQTKSRQSSAQLLENLNIKGTIITMNEQTAIVKKIWQKRAGYVLALKANQGNLLEDVGLYFSDGELLKKCAYKKTIEKARGKTEKREYWQIEDISWLGQKKE